MTLLIIRHGETPLNVARVMQPANTPLSDHGQAQAAALARRLQTGQPLAPAGIVSSDLPRALQTAEAIARACGLPVITTPLLHERNFGDLRGRLYDSLGFDPLTSADAPPNGESQADFSARCAAAWAWVLAQQATLGGPLAVVTHGLVIREWLHRGPLQLPPHLAAPERLSNTSLTVATAQAPHAVDLVDCTAHLDDGVGVDANSLSGG
ncbi:MAG: histidine phosphatase family protein [Aquabacterium sp.]|nr:histidine phosphatase family protein [Aquabacterium sp.]